MAKGARPTISVALCTFNGADYLVQQLESIAGQQSLPDELVICDDASTDSTPLIIEQFSAKAPFAVKFYRNKNRLGVIKNYEKAISLCTGDIILLSDQDDVWFPQKLETLTQHFIEDTDARVIFTDAFIVDKFGHSVGRQLLARSGVNSGLIQKEIMRGTIVNRLARKNICTGATMAFRKEILSDVLPIPASLGPFMIHDGWIAIVAALRGTLRFLDEPLIRYREHPKQQIGPTFDKVTLGALWKRSSEERRELLRQRAEFLDNLVSILRARIGPVTALLHLQEQADHYQMRSSLPISRIKRVKPILQSLFAGGYYRNARSLFGSPVADFLL
jgi:glycosyltransferase involved in cell wall biosynthesis